MSEMIATARYIALKKMGYLFFLSVMLMPVIGAGLGWLTGAPNITAFLTIVYGFLIVPALDHLIGHDPCNPVASMTDALSNETYYRWLTLACLPLQVALLIFCGYYFIHADLNLLGSIGWLISTGMVTSAIGITVAHELIHKNETIERVAGGLLLSTVCYATFKVEHVRGHHVWVATDKDHTTAKFNQTLYQFLCKVIPGNFFSGWRLEAERLVRKGLKPFSIHNELIWWYSVSALIAIAFTAVWGLQGLFFFAAQSLVAILVLEIINYVEHYGLARKPLGNGLYEPVNESHSWNSDYMVSNLMLFHLQRHSDHHYKPKKRYQVLLHQENSPQLPSGYPLMMLLAMVPRLWFKKINPMVPATNFHN